MKSMKSKLKIYCLTALILTAILSALRCLSLFLFYAPELGYFNSSPITSMITALYIASAIWLFSALIFIPKDTVSTEFISDNRVLKSGAAFAAVMFVFAFLSPLINGAKGLKEIFTAVLFLASAVFFILSAIGNKSLGSAKAALSLALILSLILELASIYFDMRIAMNSPHTILGSLNIMASMAFFLCETRIHLGKPLPTLHLASGLTAFMFGASYAISSLVYLFVKSPRAFISHPITFGNMGYLSVMIGISVYAITRCFAFGDADITATEELASKE